MKKLILPLFAAVLILGACARPEPQETPVSSTSWDVFGEEFDGSDAIPVETVAADPMEYMGRPIRVSGLVTEVCQGMGCWMSVQVPDGQNVRIVMPRDENGNYVFTLDKDLSGRRAVIEGTLDESTFAAFEEPMHGDSMGADTNEHLDGDTGEHHAEGDMADHHMEGDTMGEHGDMHTLELQLTASGVLVEKAS